jgi:hypothetical protein
MPPAQPLNILTASSETAALTSFLHTAFRKFTVRISSETSNPGDHNNGINATQ